MNRILIVYASKTGTTKQASHDIAQTLRARGLESDIVSIGEAPDLEAYSAVVIGSPINSMSLLPEVMAFIRSKAPALARKTTAIFAVAYVYYVGRRFWRGAMDKSLAKAASLAGASCAAMFPGRVQAVLPRFFGDLILGVPRDAPLDLYDSAKVRAWAESLAEELSRAR